jgi:hypothetical protein
LEILRKAKEHNPYTEVLILTYSATTDWAEQAVSEGAYTFLLRPLNDMKSFDNAVQNGLNRKQSQPQQIPSLETAFPKGLNEDSWARPDVPRPGWEVESTPARSTSHPELSKPQPVKSLPWLEQNRENTPRSHNEPFSNSMAPLPEGTFELNSKGQILSCNPAARNWLMLEANARERPIKQLIKALPSQSVPSEFKVQINGRAAHIHTKRIQDRTGSERIILVIREIDNQSTPSIPSEVKVSGNTQRQQNISTEASVSFNNKMKKYDASANDQGWSPLAFLDQMKKTVNDEVKKIKENEFFQLLEPQVEEADPDVIMTMSRRLNDVSRGRRTSY